METVEHLNKALRKGYKKLKDALKEAANTRTAELEAQGAAAVAEAKEIEEPIPAVEAALVADPAAAFYGSFTSCALDALNGLDVQVKKRAAEAKVGEAGLAKALDVLKSFVVDGGFEPYEGVARETACYTQFAHLYKVAVPDTKIPRTSQSKLAYFKTLKGSSTIPVVAYTKAVEAAYDANPDADPNQVHQAALSAAQKVARELIDDPVVEDMPPVPESSTLHWYWMDRLDVGKRANNMAADRRVAGVGGV